MTFLEYLKKQRGSWIDRKGDSKMTEAYFEYNSVKSTDMHLKIENSVAFPSPAADIDIFEVLGKDGDVVVDNERLKSVPFSLPVQLRLPDNVTVNEQATKISNWLKSNIGYSELKFSGQPDYYYMALCFEQFNISETLKQHGRTVINFRLQPYKYKADNALTEIQSGDIIANDTGRIAKPYLKISGSGDITLQNNGEDWLILNSVETYIEIDSEAMSAFKDDRLQNDKMNSLLTPMFPLLNTGNNTITATGNVSKIEIDPRLEVIT